MILHYLIFLSVPTIILNTEMDLLVMTSNSCLNYVILNLCIDKFTNIKFVVTSHVYIAVHMNVVVSVVQHGLFSYPSYLAMSQKF